MYGGDYKAIGYVSGMKEDRLPANIIASSFAKMKNKQPEETGEVSDENISRSLLTMMAGNTLQIAYMLSELENLSTIVLIGSHFDAPEFLQMCSVLEQARNESIGESALLEPGKQEAGVPETLVVPGLSGRVPQLLRPARAHE